VAVAALLAMGAGAAHAGAVLTSGNGNVMLGVEDLGATGPSTGLSLAGVGDAITPGCYCEGWGRATTVPLPVTQRTLTVRPTLPA
jgi:hypothetical protein